MTTEQQWSDWLPWSGGECPIATGQTAQFRLRGGQTYGGFPEHQYWQHAEEPYDIIAYRVPKLVKPVATSAGHGNETAETSHVASRPADKILAGLTDAAEVAAGEKPAARITVNGHTYVPAEAAEAMAAALERLLDVCGGLGPVSMAARDALALYRTNKEG